MNLSLIIIALNEADNLPRLLATVPAGVELIVLDSNSTDGTAEIVKKFGGVVHQRSFDNYAAQKNAAITYATKDWILSLDADELPSPALWNEIISFIQVNDHTRALKLRRRLVFLNHEMKFGKTADAPLRLWPREKGRFSGKIHEEMVLESGMSVTFSEESMKHYSYRDLSDYFLRFNRYTTRIAQNHFEKNTPCPTSLNLALRFPMEFITRYVLRLGFLDGYPGFVYALLSSVYGFVKYAKYKELKAQKL